MHDRNAEYLRVVEVANVNASLKDLLDGRVDGDDVVLRATPGGLEVERLEFFRPGQVELV